MGRAGYAASPGMAGTRSPSTVHHMHHGPSFGFGFFPMGGYYGGGMMGGGGGGLFSLLLMGIFAYVAINSISGALGSCVPLLDWSRCLLMSMAVRLLRVEAASTIYISTLSLTPSARAYPSWTGWSVS